MGYYFRRLAASAILQAGSVTFNSPANFTAPPRLKQANLSGKGAKGEKGNPGNKGNGGGAGGKSAGNSGGGGGGGGGGGCAHEQRPGGEGSNGNSGCLLYTSPSPRD